MHALRYFFSEAATSLMRGPVASALAILTIASGMFVLGVFLVVNANFQRVVDRWSRSAELSVYLHDDVTPEQLTAIDAITGSSGLAARREYVSKEQALARFKTDFPDLAGTAGTLENNPFPASFDVQLKPDLRESTTAVDGLVSALTTMAGVADVRYDREWLSRLNTLVRTGRIAATGIVLLLAVAAAMTVGNVVRLTAAARRDEIEIMQLVGAPFAYVRGPFVAEGILQGGIGAIVALIALTIAFYFVRTKFTALTFLALPMAVILLFSGILLGCLGGYVVARRVR
ncbi:MAG: ABC transporter permease [Acidobacteriota bacterium]|nr:ABC transporter permease [Acidobacteriota bacterium]